MKNIWWNNITNAVLFRQDLYNNVTQGRSVVVNLPSYTPWYDNFKNIVLSDFDTSLTEYILKEVEDTEDEPGNIIMKRFCSQETQTKYRPAIGYAKFLAGLKDCVLNQRYVWVRCYSQKRCDAWISFVSEYNQMLNKNEQGAVFILECQNCEITAKRNVKILNYNEYITSFDRYIYNMLLSSSITLNLDMKEYLAELVSAVTGNDIELSTQCLSSIHYRKFIDNPYDEIQNIIKTKYRSDEQEFVFERTSEDVKQSIWSAQMKIVFPIIEERRRHFVKKYYKQIQAQLPIENNMGETYETPNDVEVGMLYHMAINSLINVTSEEKELLKTLKDYRNKLAHITLLPMEDLIAILK